MSLVVGCPRCAVPLARPLPGAGWVCAEHGPIVPLWRPGQASYEGFAEHLRLAGDFPTYLPWPMSPGWRVTDFAVVGTGERPARATLTICSGTSELDGPVDLVVVAEEAGIGLGARCAGTRHDDPGDEVGQGPPSVKVRVENQVVSLWPVSVSLGGDLDRSVVAGEAQGRWLWIVLRPASAVLLLHDDWILRDVSGLGAPLLETPFGGAAPFW
jgi:hypothetical protein